MSALRIPGGSSVARRIGLITVAVLVMAQLVIALFPDPDSSRFRTVATVRAPDAGRAIESEAGPFRDLREDLHVVSLGDPSPHVVVPSRAERFGRRAYDGAPPMIPHDVPAELDRTQDCAPCHTFGGYNPSIRTYSPRTPHPEMESCMQCHVAPTETTLLVETDWVAPAMPPIGLGGELEGGPPRIPHALQMRERCMTCHGGASAAPDIRTTHPERFSCRQCHLPVEEEGSVFERTARDGGTP